jgi:hypothetical protein
MVYLTTVSGTFHAYVVVARLGADGILTELRGDMGGTYPLGGQVEVFVESELAEQARHLLLADEVAAALTPKAEPARRQRVRRGWLSLAWVLVGLLIALYLMATFG